MVFILKILTYVVCLSHLSVFLKALGTWYSWLHWFMSNDINDIDTATTPLKIKYLFNDSEVLREFKPFFKSCNLLELNFCSSSIPSEEWRGVSDHPLLMVTITIKIRL